jgi:hypothetical protein
MVKRISEEETFHVTHKKETANQLLRLLMITMLHGKVDQMKERKNKNLLHSCHDMLKLQRTIHTQALKCHIPKFS